MEPKKFIQTGTFSITVLSICLILELILLFFIGFDNTMPVAVFGFVSAVLLFCLLTFYKLTISIDSTSISFKMGVGIVSGKFLIADVQSCKPVKNNPLYGIGIRFINGGWLYNVTGLQAIELSFKNKKEIVRIGTDKPEEISEIINKMTNNIINANSSAEPKKSSLLLIVSVLILTLVFPAIFILTGHGEAKVEISALEMGIKGFYGLTIKYSEIKLLDTISVLPKIKVRTNGYALGRTLKGSFTLTDGNKARLFIKAGIHPYILIKTDNFDLYLNRDRKAATIDLYNSILSATGYKKN